MLLWWLWNAWESWGWLHLIRFYPPAQKIHGWFMKWTFWDFPLFIHLLSRSISLLPLFLDIRPWYAPIFSSLLERDPRKSGVVVMAAKLTSSASPHPSSSRSFSIPLPRLHGVSRVHVILHSFTYLLKPFTQAPISIQPIPILHATHNHIHSTRTYRIRNSSVVIPPGRPSHLEFLSPPFHPDVSHIRKFSSANIPSGHIASEIPSPPFHPDVPRILNYSPPTFHLPRISHIRNPIL